MYDVSTEEIAEKLCSICDANGYEVSEEMKSEVEEGLYWLKCAAQNKYNQEYFRTLFEVLQHIVKQ